MVTRIFVEKKQGFDVEAQGLLNDIKEILQIKGIENVRIINRYDVEGAPEETINRAITTVFSEPAVDKTWQEQFDTSQCDAAFAYSYLPGQYDQRADSAAQCIQILSLGEKPEVRSAKIVALYGAFTQEELEQIKKHCINPVDSEETSWEKPATLKAEYGTPEDVETIRGFTEMTKETLGDYRRTIGLAMSPEDFRFVQKYFAETEHRDPTMTEIRVIDTYWSDHCRHTTFGTKIANFNFDSGRYAELMADEFARYLDIRREVYGPDTQRDITLMDMGTIGAKYLKKKGMMPDADDSEEINACSIKIKADVDGKPQDWLLMFKNETHNHPTEIEPFGGAATCLGGAIRDPLSGRAYVYQAMRVTGCADPRASADTTLPGKLPQRKITKDAARGYSSYGNQIGLATGLVDEIYHNRYMAKRMEVGAVMAAAPMENVIRERPEPGDIVILVGGRTGRDGCGGATGSSKEHTADSILTCGAEVQKGNPPVERNIQRLFRRAEAARLIKRCNDFGAGGVSVAIGELADSLEVNLDLVLKKYEGLDGTELAISESQERMAVVVAAENKEKFIAYAREENLEAAAVASVTDTGRFVMKWRGKTILDLSREFLNTNGVQQVTNVDIRNDGGYRHMDDGSLMTPVIILDDLNVCSKKGLIEMFDSTIGAGTVLMPLGGKYQLTPAAGMAAKIPVQDGDTNTASLMTYGFDPYVSDLSPYHGALYAVLDSAAKINALGGDYKKARLSFQEYFEKLGDDPVRWSKPFRALLGSLRAQIELGIPAIGGKDSMSGSFIHIDVPPTLISFAVTTAEADKIISPEFKQPGSKIVYLKTGFDMMRVPEFEKFRKNMDLIYTLTQSSRILAAQPVGSHGLFAALVKMCAGNMIGIHIEKVKVNDFLNIGYGSMVLEISADEDADAMFAGTDYQVLGTTTEDGKFFAEILRENGEQYGTPIDRNLEEYIDRWKKPLESVFPSKAKENKAPVRVVSCKERPDSTACAPRIHIAKGAKPHVFIPAFPGTNCEVDSRRAFERAGGESDVLIFKNQTQADIDQSVREMADRISKSQIIMIPGGFSGGDEPDGSAKFITTVFRNPIVKEAVENLLENRDGLMLGICNGFQALIKLGLLPYGKIMDQKGDSPTLTYNSIGRHVSCLVRTRIASVKSPWMAGVNVGDLHLIPVSHGEGRLVCSSDTAKELGKNGQIATQYVDMDGFPTMNPEFNPNGSVMAIEGLLSPDGRILGKMGHSERIGKNLYRNVPGEKDQKIFESGINYFK